MKALEILKAQKAEIEKMDIGSLKTKLLQETIKDLVEINEAIAELEALQQRSCEGCRYGKFGADSRGIEVECTLIWHCARGNGFPDRYEPKEQ